MSKVLDTALTIIDRDIRLKHSEIVRNVYAETGYCDQDYNKYLAVISSGSFTLRDYIRKRKLFFAVGDLISNPEKPLAEIALEYGYSDQSAFTRAVTKEYGKTPSELRREKPQIPDNREVLDNVLVTYINSKECCPMKTSIHYSEEICKRLEAKKLTETISPYAMEYINTIMLAIFSTGYHGKTVDMEKCSDKHRTSISRFLHNDQWNASSLEKAMKELVIHTIYEEAERSGKPILCIVDDTIASKTKPSSKAIHPMQAANFHFLHLKRKQDYGHQAVGVLLSCNGITLNYTMIMYDKSVSKIDTVKQIAEELPTAPTSSYLLCDSWYVCEKVVNAFICKGFHTVGALKTNWCCIIKLDTIQTINV